MTSSQAAWRLPLIETSGTRLKVLPRRDDFGGSTRCHAPLGWSGSTPPAVRAAPVSSPVYARSSRVTECDGSTGACPRGSTTCTSTRPGPNGTPRSSSEATPVTTWASTPRPEAWTPRSVAPPRSPGTTCATATGSASWTSAPAERPVAAGAGCAHLRRILDALVTATPLRVERIRPPRIRPGSLVVAPTPLLDDAVAARLVEIVQQGSSAIVIDTLPVGMCADAPAAACLT